MKIYILWEKASYYAYGIKIISFDRKKLENIISEKIKGENEYWIETKEIDKTYPDIIE